MRLNSNEIQIIKKVINEFANEYELYLHGSRLDDDLKGGDIDLFLIFPDKIYSNIITKKHYLESQLSLQLREQKIDVTFLSKTSSVNNDFFKNSQKNRL